MTRPSPPCCATPTCAALGRSSMLTVADSTGFRRRSPDRSGEIRNIRRRPGSDRADRREARACDQGFERDRDPARGGPALVIDRRLKLPGFVREGRTERSVAADIEAAIAGRGVRAPGVRDDRRVGPNSALPHARPAEPALADGDGVVLDFGGVYDGYCVDLTRTVSSGRRRSVAPSVRRRSPRPSRRRSRRSGRASRPARSTGRSRVLERYGLGRRSGTAPVTASASRSTRSRGSPAASAAAGRAGAGRDGLHHRAGRLRARPRRGADRRRRARRPSDGCEMC